MTKLFHGLSMRRQSDVRLRRLNEILLRGSSTITLTILVLSADPIFILKCGRFSDHPDSVADSATGYELWSRSVIVLGCFKQPERVATSRRSSPEFPRAAVNRIVFS